ncbi:putative bifunctional diguanylate cyclase/phosphodiesterase [Nucisporomicrobium flavum]|uniref:putative bifunctional diguanylate cyclase/phosphodiesterase n=1 Tax=Nucisporomicrobium flavum TaxID=2785915 RepID=UPI0018F38A5F|nr:EAL domain-containing protein [Nucisporomicrobium flavum]
MTTGRLSVRLAVALALVAAVTAVGAYAVPPGSAQRLYGDAAQFAAGALAAYACLTAARDRAGPRARWRLLLGVGLATWALARLWWTIRDVFRPEWGATATIADIGLLTLPLFTLAALLAGSMALPRPAQSSLRRDRVVLLIDSVLIGGSLLALVWSAVPGRLFDEAGQNPWVVGVAAAYPVVDLVIIVAGLLLLTTRPSSRAGRVPLRLMVLAMAALGWSDTLRLLHLSAGGPDPIESAGYLAGPALLALAAWSNTGLGETAAPDRSDAEWLHLLLPYVPVVATGIVIAVRTGTGGQLTSYEAYLGWLGLGLVVARQMFTIVDNTVLLARVSEGRQRLHHQAYHDPLTGLANRALFRERLVLALDAYRFKGVPVALLFADLDDFKLINDGFGHAVGDRLLRGVAERLLACVGPEDVVARLGGDEFAVLLQRRGPEAEEAGRRILAALREPYELDGHTVGASASLGLVLPEPGDEELSADVLLRRADAAMYVSKRRGKNDLARYSGAADGGPNADLPHLLTRALSGDPAEHGFEVHYQPIVRLTDGAVVAVEALARWTDPVAGPVDPDVFVTVAERTGLVAGIDDFVLERACADAAALANAYGRPIDVHVNVSAARLGRHGLQESVLQALERHAVRPSRLVVEITETLRIPDLPRAVEVLEHLRRRGVRVALDDFGSGWNALAQLHSLPVDIVKLDSSLTDVDVAERAGDLCRSVLRICADLGIAVIAEGIETPARSAALAGLGCRFGQGYLFGQPGPARGLGIPAQPGPATTAHLAS